MASREQLEDWVERWLKANKDAEEAGGHKIPIEDEQPDPSTESGSDPGPAQDGDTLQFENAETSLDQPSEG